MYQQMIFVNLPVNDLDASKKFFTELGYTINPQFSDENAASVVISDTIVAMLLTKPFYATFTKKEIADATTTSEVLICLSAESREKVDELVDKAIAAGGTASGDHPGPRLHVRPCLRRPRRPHLGGHVDGPGGRPGLTPRGPNIRASMGECTRYPPPRTAPPTTTRSSPSPSSTRWSPSTARSPGSACRPSI